jgi:hypothetical protein
MGDLATSDIVRAGLLVAVIALLAGACGGDEEGPRREGHQAFVATERAVTYLSLARGPEGALPVASWREQAEDGDLIAWVSFAEADVIHEATLGPSRLDWQLSRLLNRPGGLTRMALGEGQFGQLQIDQEGALTSYGLVYALGDIQPPFRAVGLAEGAAVLAQNNYDTGLQLWVPLEADWFAAGIVSGLPCYGETGDFVVSFAAAALSDDRIVVVDLELDLEQFVCVPKMHVIQPGAEGLEHVEIAGSVVDPITAAPTWVVADVVVTPQDGIGVLWLSFDGHVRVTTAAGPVGFDFDAPVFDAGGAVVTDARLLSTADRLVVTYRTVGDGAPSSTLAVVINPVTGEVAKPFHFPVDDAECADLVGLPIADGIEYACVGRCEGVDCREHWIFHGRAFVR